MSLAHLWIDPDTFYLIITLNDDFPSCSVVAWVKGIFEKCLDIVFFYVSCNESNKS